MTYNALKSIDLTKFMKVLMCFLVSCSNGRGHVCVCVCVCVCVWVCLHMSLWFTMCSLAACARFDDWHM